MDRALLVLGALALAGCGASTGSGPMLGDSGSIECAPYARQVTGIQLYGDAASWWEQSRGLYERSSQPAGGGVLVFQRSGRLPYGHVSVVVDQVSGREIRVSQANWVHHRITRNEPVIDVSPENDWSRVRVWWAPANSIGTTVYPTYGFILPSRRRGPEVMAETAAP